MPSSPSSHAITRLLQGWGDGDENALEELTRLLYRELHKMAVRQMRQERPEHTLQPTALINEAYMRLMDWKNVRWQNRAHFFAVSAQLMRRILVDFARSRKNAKHGDGVLVLPLEEARVVSKNRASTIVVLDEALDRLIVMDARKSRIVELRFFGGLSADETAEF
jgi:RNA polymerase sigma factor (TIGR02999 family)